MNELSEKFLTVSDGDCIILEKNKTYSIYPENGFHLNGLFFSNTAKRNENPNGERFCGIYLENKRNVTIDGNGARLLIHGVMTPFIFKNCQNIILKNLEIDHFRPTMSEFTVIESEAGRATIRISDEYLYRLEGNMLYWRGENNLNGEPYWEIPYRGIKVLSNSFDPETGIVKNAGRDKGDIVAGFPKISEIRPIDKNTLSLKFQNKKKLLPRGTVFQTRSIVRYQTGGAFDECDNVILENMRIKSMNGFGILAQNSSNLTYRGLDITPAEGRTCVSDADFFHFSGCKGEIKITDCRATGAHDDIINVHGTHLRIISVKKKSREMLMRYCHKESWGFNPYKQGDEIEFVSGNTLIPYGGATVEAVDKLNDTDYLIKVSELPERKIGKNDVVENVSRTASLTVIGNIFERIPTRAILCTTRKDVLIKGNAFGYMGAPVICVADDANFWFESGRSGKIIFEENTVIDCAANEADRGADIIRYEPVVMDKKSKQAVHEKIIIRNNKFINNLSDRYTINLNYLREAEISGNDSNVPLIIKADDILERKTVDGGGISNYSEYSK